MIDIDAFVKKNYSKMKELGLAVESEESSVIESLKRYPMEMLDDIGEEGIVAFLFIETKFSDVFYTDFEGIEYEEFLKNCQRISGDELCFGEVTNDVADEISESGEGSSEVSFEFEGTKYNYTAKVYYDWFDIGFIAFLNSVLEQIGMKKRIIAFGDPNGVLITYQEPDFCKRLKEAYPMLEIYAK